MNPKLSALGLFAAAALVGCYPVNGPIPEAGMVGSSKRFQSIASHAPTPPPRPANRAADAKLLSGSEVKPQSPAADAAAGLAVATSAFAADGKIPHKYSDYGEKVSPDLSIANVPANAKSLVLLVEDPDSRDPKPFIHWVLYNLTPSTSYIPEAQPASLKLGDLGNALQGTNSNGSIGYYGMHPPAGDKPHHYHFQLFALDKMLDLPPGAERSAVRQAMDGHVISQTEIVGTYAAE